MPYPPPGDLPNPGIQTRSPTLQADSLPSDPPGKPMNTGDGSLSLFQGIFLTQEFNMGLLHCRWILYQLRYQGSPMFIVWIHICIYVCVHEYILLFSRPVMSNSLQPHGLQHARPPCPSPSPRVCPSSCSFHR